jgi:hypothetical protein
VKHGGGELHLGWHVREILGEGQGRFKETAFAAIGRKGGWWGGGVDNGNNGVRANNRDGVYAVGNLTRACADGKGSRSQVKF